METLRSIHHFLQWSAVVCSEFWAIQTIVKSTFSTFDFAAANSKHWKLILKHFLLFLFVYSQKYHRTSNSSSSCWAWNVHSIRALIMIRIIEPIHDFTSRVQNFRFAFWFAWNPIHTFGWFVKLSKGQLVRKLKEHFRWEWLPQYWQTLSSRVDLAIKNLRIIPFHAFVCLLKK